MRILEDINDLSELNPEKILEIAKRDPLAYYFVREWKEGRLTWEQALVGLCLELSKHNRLLIAEMDKMEDSQPLVINSLLTEIRRIKEHS